jgi:hypothetical protein
MRMGLLIAMSLALLAQDFTPAEASARRVWRRAHPARHVYWVLRFPGYIPPPQPPERFCFAFCPTNRVNTHMY